MWTGCGTPAAPGAMSMVTIVWSPCSVSTAVPGWLASRPGPRLTVMFSPAAPPDGLAGSGAAVVGSGAAGAGCGSPAASTTTVPDIPTPPGPPWNRQEYG